MNSASSSTELDPAQLIVTHQAAVWRYLRVLGCESSLAEDITQETFLAVLQKPFRQYSQAATAAYLRRVAHNLYVSAQRRAGKLVVVEEIEQLETDWVRFAGDDGGESALQALRQCFQRLTERAQRALQLRFQKRLPRAGIAADLGITEHGAKNLMQRAKKQLRSCVEGQMNRE